MSLTRMGAREAFLVLHLGLPEDKDPGEAGRAEEQWGDSSEIGNARPAFPLARGPPLLPVPRAGGAKRRSANVHNDILLRADVRREGGVWNRWKFTFRLCCPQPWGRFRHRVEDGKVEPMLKPGPFPVYCKIHRQWGLGERVTIHAVNGSRGPALDTCDTLVTFLRYSNSEG